MYWGHMCCSTLRVLIPSSAFFVGACDALQGPPLPLRDFSLLLALHPRLDRAQARVGALPPALLFKAISVFAAPLPEVDDRAVDCPGWIDDMPDFGVGTFASTCPLRFGAGACGLPFESSVPLRALAVTRAFFLTPRVRYSPVGATAQLGSALLRARLSSGRRGLEGAVTDRAGFLSHVSVSLHEEALRGRGGLAVAWPGGAACC